MLWMAFYAIHTHAAERVYGLERLTRLDLLPCLTQGTRAEQVSSHDRGGANDDGFFTRYSTLYVDAHGEHVMFDEIGAGCLYRIWMTYPPGWLDSYRLRFYFDNEPSPRIDLSLVSFFDGVDAPLEFPLVGNRFKSSEGYYCYVPFPFRERLKITLSGPPQYYNMTYHRFDSSDGIVSWTGNEDYSIALEQWRNAGIDPKSTNGSVVVYTNLVLAASATGTLFRITGAGCVQSLTLDPSPATPGLLSGLRLQMNWDQGQPEVDVPLGHFFGSGMQEVDVTSLPIGMRTSGNYYCHFPMPYWTSADITLVNTSPETLTHLPCSVRFITNVYDRASSGLLHADFKKNVFVHDSTDVNFLDRRGRGHVVGLSLLMQSFGSGGDYGMAYLEGDERIYMDGSRSPSLHGTGAEDYFNAGWYFGLGIFNLPTHGMPWQDHRHTDRTNHTQAYRFHLSDILPFTSSIRFGMEHGVEDNNAPGTYSSVVYYYALPGDAAGQVLTADLDVGDAWSEAVYGYRSQNSGLDVSHQWSYEGDFDGVAIRQSGHSHTGGLIEFTVPLIENTGIVLRRTTDQGFALQRASVEVNGLDVGTWYEADGSFSNVYPRWLDSEFLVPPDVVTGAASARVRITPDDGTLWNEYRYQVFCVKPLEAVPDVDEDGLPDAWERAYVDDIAQLSEAGDADGDSLSDTAEFVAGTDPTQSVSLLRILPGKDVVFESVRGRLYALEQCSDLMFTNWISIRTELPGTGARMCVPADDVPTAFRRIRVHKP